MSVPSIVQMPIHAVIAQSQVRHHFDQESLEALAQSIRELGILQPLLVRMQEKDCVIVDGERRHRAAIKAGLTTVPVIVKDKDLAAEVIIQTQLVANCQREDLKPVEKAAALAQLVRATGWTGTKLAAKLGMTDTAVTRSLAILRLPQAIRDQVDGGIIPVSAAYDLVRIKDPEQQAELARRLAERALTRDALAGIVKARRKDPPSVAGPQPKRATVILSASRSITLADDALDLDRLIASLEEALGKARKARTQGIELKTFCQMLKEQAKG